jgi:hypothetical protein
LSAKPTDTSFSIISFNTFVSRETVFKISYTPGIDLVVGDFIELHFETNSELDTVFANDLGFTDFGTN